MDKSIKARVSWAKIEDRGHGNEEAGENQCEKQASSAERCYQQLFYHTHTAKRKSENHHEPSEEIDVVVNNHHSRIVGGGTCRGDSAVGSQEADDNFVHSNNRAVNRNGGNTTYKQSGSLHIQTARSATRVPFPRCSLPACLCASVNLHSVRPPLPRGFHCCVIKTLAGDSGRAAYLYNITAPRIVMCVCCLCVCSV